jgi:hypothetical protein
MLMLLYLNRRRKEFASIIILSWYSGIYIDVIIICHFCKNYYKMSPRELFEFYEK